MRSNNYQYVVSLLTSLQMEKNADFFVPVLILEFASTKRCATLTHCLLQNTDQDWILVVSLLQF